MNRYRVLAWGRKKGAIGIMGAIVADITAENEEAARLKMYDDYEHLTHVRIIRRSDKEQQ